MPSVSDYAKMALEMKKKGLSDKEIADELHLSLDTVAWLLICKKRKKAPPTTATITQHASSAAAQATTTMTIV